MIELNSDNLKKIIIPLVFPVLLWIVHIFSVVFNIDLVALGVLPRTAEGLKGILFAPLVHENFDHLFSNTLPLIVLGYSIFYFYPHSAYKVFAMVYIITNILVWIFAREAYHIGASGVIYGLLSFIFFSGIFRRDNRSIALALLVTFLYGGLVWGVLPGAAKISWESHFFGGVTGLAAAFIFRSTDKPKRYDWEDEPDEEKPEKLEISYDPEKNKFNF